jgi:2-oxoisovalerate dehydrogenase E1 component alpha subunit
VTRTAADPHTTPGDDRAADLTRATADVQPTGTAGSAPPVPAPEADVPETAGASFPDPGGDDPMVRLLSPEGERVEHPDYDSNLDRDSLRAMYRDMALGRRIDLEGTNLQRQGQLCLWPPLTGQEAAQVGAVHALRDTDFVYPSCRELAMGMARGLDPMDVFRMFRGVEHTSWDVHEHGFGLYSIVVGAQTVQAVGYGMAINLDGADDVVLCCLGDGGSSEGHVSEAMNFAAVFNAPVVFLVQNNQWAISVPTANQYKGPLSKRAEGFGFPGVRVDGNDVLAVRAVTERAVERARQGGGPTWIEAFTFRVGAHTTADDPSRYREKVEEEFWLARDPLARLEAHLRKHADTGDDFFEQVKAEGDAMAADVRAQVVALPEPVLTDLYADVYAEMPTGLAAEKAAMESYLSSFGSDA